MGASCSTGEGTRLESTASLERRFEGAGCNGRALGSVPLSHVPESARFRCFFVVLLDFWGSTEGPTLHGLVRVWTRVRSDPKAELQVGRSGAGWTGASTVPSALG